MIASTAIIGKNVAIGKNVQIWNYVVIQDDTYIGNNVKIGSFTDIGKGVVIEDDTTIQCHVSIPNNTKIGKRVFIGPQVFISNDKFPPEKNSYVIIRDNVIVGGNASIIAQEIGKNVVIGANTVITKNIPSNGVWIGNPAYHVYDRKEYERKKGLWQG